MTTCQNDNSREEAADARSGQTDDYDWQSSRFSTGQAPVDWTLKASRTLALVSLILAAFSYFQPQFDSLSLCACFIGVLFLVNAGIQRWHKQRVMNNERGFVGLPISSPLWSLALPLALALVSSNIVAYYQHSTDWLTQFRWNAVVVVSVITSVAFTLKAQVLDHPKFAATLLGISLGSSLALFCLLLCHFVFNVKVSNVFDIGMYIALPLIVCGYHLGSLKKMLLRLDHQRTLGAFCSTFIASIAFLTAAVAPEARATAIAAGENMASSDNQSVCDLGFSILKAVDAPPEMLKQVRGERFENAMVLAMVPANAELFPRLYFELTGKPLPVAREVDTNATDVNLGNITVGNLRPGLSLQESQLTGHVDAKSLTSALYWTLVFNNQGEQPEEARCSIVLPPGAVVSRATLWINGKEQEAAFDTRQKVQAAYQWIVQRKRDPLLITETEDGLIHLQAYPVPKWGEMKVRFGITAPLDPKTNKQFKLEPPRVLSANFETSGAPTNVKLESNASIIANIAGGQSSAAGQDRVILKGQYKLDNPSQRLQFTINSKSEFKGLVSRATHAESNSFITQSLAKVADSTAALAIVLDGSTSVAKQMNEIERGLKNIPASIKTKFFVANRHEPETAVSLAESLTLLRKHDVAAGCDDSNALEQARGFVARERRGTILWIHGSQSFISEKDRSVLKKLMMRGDHRLKIYDYQIDSDEPNELRSYLVALDKEASPEFKTVYQSGSVAGDLTEFAHNTLDRGAALSMVRQKTHNASGQNVVYDFSVASRMSTLWAAEEARRLIARGETDAAGLLGSVYRIVTPVTGAVVLEREDDYQATDLNRNMYAVASDKKLSGAMTHSEMLAAGGGGGADSSMSETDGSMGFSNSPEAQTAQKAAASPAADGPAQPQFAPRRSPRRIAQAMPMPVPVPSAQPQPAPVSGDSSGATADYAAPEMETGTQSNSMFQQAADPAWQGATTATSGMYVPAPALQGATNGTIAPQGGDAANIVGLNTAGSQRLRNSANIESTTGAIAGSFQLIAVILGLWLIACGFVHKANPASIRSKLLCGSMLLTAGIALPKAAMWFVGLAMSANLL